MRFKLNNITSVACATTLAIACNLNAQDDTYSFRIEEPIPVTNQLGKQIKLVGMQGKSVSFQLDGIFVGTTRSAEMRNAMIASLAVYLAACWLLIPALGNHGLWLSLMVFMAARTITLGFYFPRLERAVAGPAD